MKKLFVLLLLLQSCLLFAGWAPDSNTVIVAGKRDFEQKAALRVQQLLMKAAGVRLSIQKMSKKMPARRIVVGEDASLIRPALRPGEMLVRYYTPGQILIAGGDAAGMKAALNEFALRINTIFVDTPFEMTHRAEKSLWIPDSKLEFRYAPVSHLRKSGGKFNFTITGDCVIVLPPEATPTEKRAAEELRKYLKELSGVTLEIASDPGKGSNILIGSGLAADRLPEVDFNHLREDEIIIDTPDANTLVLAGAPPRATLYAVYELLEEQFGILFLAPDCEIIPKQKELKIPELHIAYAPPFVYRQATDAAAPISEEEIAFQVKSRINGSMYRKIQLPPEWGGYHYHEMDHTLDPGRKWFLTEEAQKTLKEHPEYRAYRKGEKERAEHHFCLSNPDAKEFILRCMLAYVAEHPECNGMVSFGEGDDSNLCQCDECEATRQKYQTPGAGAWLLANEAAKRYPNLKIVMQAYGEKQTLKIPAGFQWNRRGVSIGLAILNRSHGHPFGGDAIMNYLPLNPEAIYIWDYFANFVYYMLPIPSLPNIPVNLKRYAMLNVHGVYAQMPQSALGDFLAYRRWIFGQCAWNPDKDPEKLFQTFFDHYYGPAAPFLKEYARSRKLEHWKHGAKFVGCYNTGVIHWLGADGILNSLSLLNQGENAVEGQADYTRRVRNAKAGILLACLLHYDEVKSRAAERKEPFPAYQTILEELKTLMEETKTVSVSERFSVKNMVEWLETQSAPGQKNEKARTN